MPNAGEMKEIIVRELQESAGIKRIVAHNLSDKIASAARMIVGVYKAGGKMLLVGNGGSAADAQHLAAELVGHFRRERGGLPAIALTTNTSVLTALANDYSYDIIFSRQLEALASDKDVLVALTTSGTSPNIIKAVETAKSKGLAVLAMTGENGGRLESMADLTIAVPSENKARIQEAHVTVGHILCHLLEEVLFNE